AQAMHKAMPDADIICPLGPVQFTSPKHNVTAVDGKRTWVRHESWLDYGRIYLNLLFNRMAVVEDLNRMIDRELAARNLTNDRLALFGFSLGGTIALLTAFTRAVAPAAVAAHSGMFFPFRHITAKPPTLWIMGDADKRYDAETEARKRTGIISRHFNYFHTASVERLQRAGIPLETRIVPGLDHDISDESMQNTIDFMKQKLERT
ncbi:MAG TPA: dienelactone hydrolase family protein, partial [Alphaproteobacteria bacterium]